MIPVEEQSPEQGDSDLDFEPGPTEYSGSDSQVSDAEPTSPPRLPWFGRGQSVVPMPSPASPPGFSRRRMWLFAHYLVPHLVMAEEGERPQAGGVLEAAGSLQHLSM